MAPNLDDRRKSILQAMAQACSVNVEALEDAYPCPKTQAEQFAASMQTDHLLHYNFIYSLRDRKSGTIGLLKQAVDAVCRRNTILRTRIVQLADKTGCPRAYYAVLKEEEAHWNTFENLEQYCRENLSSSVRSGDILSSFGISKEGAHLVWTVHHGLYDGWSIGLLTKEIGDHLRAGEILEHALPRPSYSRFISYLCESPSTAASKFWADRLQGYTGPALKAPLSLPETNVRRDGVISIPKAGRGNLNLADCIQAAWALALARWFGVTDVMFLTYSTGRNCPVDDVAEMTGPCLCIVPFRIQCDLESSLEDFIERVGALSRATLEHEHAGLHALRTFVEPDRRPNHLLNVTHTAHKVSKLPGMDLQTENVFHKQHLDWVAQVYVDEEEMQWELCADRDRLPTEAIDFLSCHFPELILICTSVGSVSKNQN